MSHKLSNLFVRPTDKIKTVLERLSSGKLKNPHLPPGVALVVDGNNKLLGIVTNGDIRRAFEADITVDQPISKVMNKNPSVIKQSERSEDLLPLIFNKMKEGKWPKDRLERILVVDDA
ncbi:MAG: CBS domain-containing protein, partial [Patescibacteria group bacterium]